MGASRFQIFRKIVLRSALPHVMTGLRTAMPQAVVGAMVGEFISSRRGLGFLIAEATGRFDTAAAFAGIITISLIVLTMFMLLQLGNELRLRPQQ
jgi:NitT/TauT family transport system permease protein